MFIHIILMLSLNKISNGKKDQLQQDNLNKQINIKTPYLFDWIYYLEKYPDLRTNGVHTEHQAISHWHSFGEKEQRVAIRTPYLFDWKYYLEKYPDLRMNGVKNEDDSCKKQELKGFCPHR